MDVTAENFETEVIERSRELPVVVDFWAAWCGPCRALGPAIESEIEKREGKLTLTKIDVDAEQVLAARYGIQSIPTVAVFRDGEPVTGFIGAHPASAIGSFLDEVIEKPPEPSARRSSSTASTASSPTSRPRSAATAAPQHRTSYSPPP